MKLFNFVDYAACINLNHRTDKKNYIERHFSDLGILSQVKRFEAVEPSEFISKNFPEIDVNKIDKSKITSDIKAHCGWISHYKIIKEAKQIGARNVLIFEDDAEFYKSEDYSAMDLVKSAIAQLKTIADWQVLYLGALPDPGEHQAVYELVTPNLIRIYECYGSHAVLYNNTVFDQMIYDCENFDKNMPTIAADTYLNIAFKHKYVIYPMAVIQKKFNSDIVDETRDWFDFKKYYGKIKNRTTILF
jgi:hypothetical protein